MPNAVTQIHRQKFPDDARSDDELTLEYVSTYGDDLLKDFPDVAGDYRRIRGLEPVLPDLTPEQIADMDRRMYPTSLLGEAGRGLKRGSLGLASTAVGAVGLGLDALGAEGMGRSVMKTSQRLGEEAAAPELAPTVKGIEDVTPSNAVRWLASAAGEVAPSIAEAIVTGAAGALAGSATVPGPGTVAGGVAGVVGKEAAKQMLKKAVRAKIGAVVASGVNSFGLNAGEIYNDLSQNPNITRSDAINLAIGGGLVAGAADTVLPSYVIGKFFKREIAKGADEAVHKYVTRLFIETAKVVPFEAGTEAFQELVGIAAEKYGDATQRDTPLTDAQWSRIRNAAALGAVGGGLAAPIAAIPTGRAAAEPAVVPPASTEDGEDGLDMARRYETRQQEQARATAEQAAMTETLTAIAQRELTTGLTVEEAVEQTKRTPEQAAEYARIIDRLRSTAAPPNPNVVGSATVADLQIAIRLPSGEVISDPAARLHSDLIASKGVTEEQIADQTTDFGFVIRGVYHTKEQALSPLKRDDILGSAGLNLALEQGTIKPTTPLVAPAAPAVVTPPAALPIAVPPTVVTPPAPPPPQPVNEKNLFAIAQDFVDRLVNIPNLPAVQQNNLNFVWTQMRTQSPAAAENLATYFGLTLDEASTQMPERYAHVQPVTTASWFSGVAPSATQVPLKVAAGRAAATAAVLNARPRGPRVAQVSPARAVTPTHPIVDAIDFESRPLAATEGAGYFTISGVTPKTSNEELQRRKVAAGRGTDTTLPKTTTHRLTAMLRKDGRVILMPTYMSDAGGKGTVIVAEPGRKVGRSMRDLIGKGQYTPIASLYLTKAVDAISYAKPVFADVTEFHEKVGRPAKERLSAAKRTADAMRARMARYATTAQVGLPGDEENPVLPTPDEAENPEVFDEPVLPAELALPGNLATGIHDGILAVIEAERDSANKRSVEEAVFDVLADYATNGKYGKQLTAFIRGLIGHTGEASVTDFFIGRVAAAYNNSQGSTGFAELLSGKAVSPVARSGGGLPGPGGNSGIRAGGPAVPVPATPANGGVAAGTRKRGTRPRKPKLRIGEPGGYNRSGVIVARWTALLDALALRGVPVQIFEQHLSGVIGLSPQANEFFQRTGGGVSDNGIALVVSDLTAPTQEDFVAALHEVAHEVFAGETPQMQAAIHRAIDSLSDVQLGIATTTDARISSANPAGLDPLALSEERGVESVAQTLQQQGFDPSTSRGLAQAIWRYLKDLYYRAAMALQQAFFGPEHVNPQRVQEYFNNRVRQFLSNDPTPMDFLSFLGGGRPTAIRQSMFYTPHDHSFVPVLMDWKAGRMVYQDFIPDTVAAALLNIDNSIREARTMFTGGTPQAGAVPHRAEPPSEMRQVLDREGVVYIGSMEVPSDPTKAIYMIEIYDPVSDPTGIRGANINFRAGTPEATISERIAAKRSEFGWQSPREMFTGASEEKPGLVPFNYGFSADEIAASGGDVKRAIDAQHERLKREAAAERASDNYDWNTSNPRWGKIWTAVKQDDTTRLWRVIGGMEGNLKGLDIAHFRSMDAAYTYAKDFKDGTAFALENNGRWIAMVESANAAKRLIQSDVDLLKSHGRTQGMDSRGDTVEIDKLRRRYESPARFRSPGTVSGPEVIGGEGATVRAQWDYSGAKKVSVILHAMFDQFVASGQNVTVTGQPLFTYETFFDAIKGDLNLPEEVMAGAQQRLVDDNAPPLDPNKGLDGPVRFQNEFTERQVQSKALGAVGSWQKQMSEEYGNASRRIKGTQRALERKLSQQEQMAANYQHRFFHFRIVNEAIKELLTEFKGDLGKQTGMARTLGGLMQSVKELQAAQSEPVNAATENLLNRMARRIAGNEPAFMEFLETISQLDIDWENTPLVTQGDVVGIRDMVDGVMQANSFFENLGTSERNAVIAMTAAFARQHNHLMSWLAIKQAEDHETGAAIKEALAQAKKETNADLRDARKLINRVPRMAVRADRIFRKYLEARQEAQRLNDTLQKDTRYISAYQEMVKVLEPEAQKLEAALGANDAAALTEGEDLPYVNLVTDTPEMLKKNTWEYHVTGDQQATTAEIRNMIDRYNGWLDYHRPEGGMMWNKINDLVKKLEMVDANKFQVANKPTILNKIFGSLSDLANGTGTTAGLALGRMFTNYTSKAGAYSQRHADLGFKIVLSAEKAMKALGLQKRPEMFYGIFHDQALKYFENRRDLQDSGTPEQATEAALQAVQLYFANHPQAGRFMSPKGWVALREYYLYNAQQTGLLARTAKEMGVKVQDDNLKFLRDPLGQPLFTHPRGMSTSLEALFGGPGASMREAWAGTKWPKLTAESVTQALNSEEGAGGVEALKALLGTRFTPGVWNGFVKPLAHRPGRSVFNGHRTGDGRWVIASVENVRLAFEQANGDPITFATGLASLEAVPESGLNEFVGETMDTFQRFFDSVNTVMSESEAFKENAGMSASVPRYLMDARISEEWPAEWLSYQRYDQNVSRNLVHLMAYHASFGRNGADAFKHFGTAVDELEHAEAQWQTILEGVKSENVKAGRLEVLKLARAKATAAGSNAQFLENAVTHRRTINHAKDQFIDWFRTQTSDLIEAKTLFEAVGTLAGLLVQGPKTALINTMDMIAGPVLQVGLNRRALAQIRRNWSSFAASVFNSLSAQVGSAYMLNAENMLRRQKWGYVDPSTTVTWKERVKAELAAPVTGGLIATAVTRVSRIARTFTQVGIPTPGNNQIASRFKPQAAFTDLGQRMNFALIDGVWFQYEDMALRARNFMQEHPEVIGDPAFRFTWQDLGYPKSLFSEQSFAFESLKEGLNRWRMTVEGIGRAAVKEGAPLYTEEQMRDLASMAVNELSLESGPVTRPAWFHNPIIRFITPLLGWSFSKTAQLRKAFREPGGEASYYAAARGTMMMLSAMLPLGLLYGLLMQKYDEEITGKKSDIRGFGQDNNALAAVEQLARVGTFGLWGDIANTIGNFAGQGDLRGISFDNRVIAVNSLMHVFTALGTFLRQGEATYSTVYRPLLQATGGSGYLQYAQIVNNAIAPETTGGIPLIGHFLENERRVTSRINVSNWLRAGGRGLNLDVRMGRGGQAALPNSIKPFTSSMLLDALADDILGFQSDYQEAIRAAREEGKPDPEDHVKRSFQAMHPLNSAFRTKPSVAEYHQLLASLPEDGRRDVQDAVNLYNRYAATIGIRESEGKEEKRKKAKAPFSIEAIRRRALGNVLGSPWRN